MTAATTVVIPNHDGRAWLPGLLASLAAQSEPASEVIVVDDASRDGSADWLAHEHPAVRVISLARQRGFAAAVNVGIAACATELVALVNTDVELDPRWLARMAARFEDAAVGAAACKMVSLTDPRVIDDAGDVVRRDGACLQRGRGHRDDGRYDVAGEAFGACAGAALYRRAALEAVGGLDERYVAYLEDADLALALRAARWRCVYEPVVARHAGRGSAPSAVAHLDWVARNTPLLVAKWFSVRWLPQVAYRQLALLALAARQNRLPDHLHALGAGLRLVPAAIRDRPAAAIPRAQLIPRQPIRGPRAEGHPARAAASWDGHNRRR